MAVFSGSRAVGAGFMVIRREPAAFAVWCLVLAALYIGPFALLLRALFDSFPELMELSRDGAEPDPRQMLALQAGLFAYYPLVMLGGLACGVLLAGAAYRAVLAPDDRRFFYLRVSPAEGWMTLGFAAVLAVALVAYIGLLIPMAVLFAVAAANPDSPAIVFAFVFIFAGLVAFVWLMLRFSLSPVASFAERRLVLPEAWAMARGQVVKMFGVYVVLALVMFVVQLALSAVGFALAFGFTPRVWEGGAATAPQEVFSAVPLPVWVLAGVLFAAFYTLYLVLHAGAWASIYRDLKATA